MVLHFLSRYYSHYVTTPSASMDVTICSPPVPRPSRASPPRLLAWDSPWPTDRLAPAPAPTPALAPRIHLISLMNELPPKLPSAWHGSAAARSAHAARCGTTLRFARQQGSLCLVSFLITSSMNCHLPPCQLLLPFLGHYIYRLTPDIP